MNRIRHRALQALPLLAFFLPALARGADFYSEADLGALIFIGPGADDADPGPAFGGRMGIGIFSWLSVGAYASASTHSASVPTPSVGQIFQLYQAGGDLRLRVRAGKIGFFAEGGGGWSFFSTNVLDVVGITKPDQHNGPYLTAGGGLEYATDNPRYAFGLAGDFTTFPQFGALEAVSVRFYLRYTK